MNVADGATSVLKDILFRLRELSTQSSNGTFSNAQRQSIDKESQGLQAEYGRILGYHELQRYLCLRQSGDVVVQAGVGLDAVLLVNISGCLSYEQQRPRATGRLRQAGLSRGAPALISCYRRP